jgi:ABC-type nitrate/sulfonate/bicarbonate transport system permease component
VEVLVASVATVGRRSFARKSTAVNWPGILFIVFLLVLWDVCVDLRVITYEYLPAPHAIAGALWQLAKSGELARDVTHTVAITLAGWAASAILGVALGVLLGIRAWAWRYSFASLELLRALPPIALVPAVLILAGFTAESELIVVIYASILPITVYTIAGVRRVT